MRFDTSAKMINWKNKVLHIHMTGGADLGPRENQGAATF